MTGHIHSRVLPLVLCVFGFGFLLTFASPLPRGDYWNFLHATPSASLYWWGAHTGQHHSEFAAVIRWLNFHVTAGDARGMLLVSLLLPALCLGLVLRRFVPLLGGTGSWLRATGLCLVFLNPGQIGVWVWPLAGVEWWSVHACFFGALFLLSHPNRSHRSLWGAGGLAVLGLNCFSPAFLWATALAVSWVAVAKTSRLSKALFVAALALAMGLHLAVYKNPGGAVPALETLSLGLFLPYLSALLLFPPLFASAWWLLVPFVVLGVGVWKGTETERLWVLTLGLAVLLIAFSCFWYRGPTPAMRYSSLIAVFWVAVVLAIPVSVRVGRNLRLCVPIRIASVVCVVLWGVSCFSWQQHFAWLKAKHHVENFPFVAASMALGRFTPRYYRVLTTSNLERNIHRLKEMGHLPFDSGRMGQDNWSRLPVLTSATLKEWTVVTPHLAEFCVETDASWGQAVEVGQGTAVLVRTPRGQYCGVADVTRFDSRALFAPLLPHRLSAR